MTQRVKEVDYKKRISYFMLHQNQNGSDRKAYKLRNGTSRNGSVSSIKYDFFKNLYENLVYLCRIAGGFWLETCTKIYRVAKKTNVGLLKIQNCWHMICFNCWIRRKRAQLCCKGTGSSIVIENCIGRQHVISK